MLAFQVALGTVRQLARHAGRGEVGSGPRLRGVGRQAQGPQQRRRTTNLLQHQHHLRSSSRLVGAACTCAGMGQPHLRPLSLLVVLCMPVLAKSAVPPHHQGTPTPGVTPTCMRSRLCIARWK